MTVRSFLCLTTAISILALACTNVFAAQIDQYIPPNKTPKGQLDFTNLLNVFFKDDELATRQVLDQRLATVSSQLETNLLRAQELGFGTNPKEVKIPHNAIPFLMFHVGLNDLCNFGPDKEASDLLMFTNQLLFPVEIRNKVSSSVTVRLPGANKGLTQQDQETDWSITRWGLPKLIRQLDELAKGLPPETLRILVSIPSLNRSFLGYLDGANLKLVPLGLDHLTEAQKPLSAKEVFLGLVQEAKHVNGNPR